MHLPEVVFTRKVTLNKPRRENRFSRGILARTREGDPYLCDSSGPGTAQGGAGLEGEEEAVRPRGATTGGLEGLREAPGLETPLIPPEP